MNMTIDTWLTRFAAGAGSAYRWQLMPVSDIRGRIEHLVRAVLPHDVALCSISAQATYETGHIYPVSRWRAAAVQQEITDYGNHYVIERAADDDGEADPEVRPRLLRICGLRDASDEGLSAQEAGD